MEVLDRIPPKHRSEALREMHRVLRPGGRLILQLPHAGAFAWLDPGNFRFRFPRLYSLLLGPGLREHGMRARTEGVQWHQHFSLDELQILTAKLFAVDWI
jgi:SAM-dependent methyltransferase